MFLKCCKFLTVQKALDILWTLDDSDVEDANNDLVILSPDPDSLSDTEETDNSSERKVEEIVSDENCISVLSYRGCRHDLNF